jgi:DNA-binding transcriptional LysR family regulator
MGYEHNAFVMHDLDPALTKWLRPRASSLNRATLGQLVVLMDLVGADSVVDIGRGTARPKKLADAAVNSRQKLTRLEESLGVGKLTRREGKATRLTTTGRRVAGEIRLFLQELRHVATREAEAPTWIIGAGETWLHSVIIPALARLARSHPQWRWEVRNIRAEEIRSGLRDGLLHLGFFREAEMGNSGEFAAVSRLTTDNYRVIVGDNSNAPSAARDLVRWALRNNRPLAQQGSTWPHMRALVGNALSVKRELEEVVVHLTCQNHPQAISLTEASNAWCIVPAFLGRKLPIACSDAVFKVKADTLTLTYHTRAAQKHAEHEPARQALAEAIRVVTKQHALSDTAGVPHTSPVAEPKRHGSQ